jgi:esterase
MKLNYKIFGSGPPLIILHGLFGMLDNWRTIAKMLEDKYQCILVDLRNHGRSPHNDEMNYKVMTEDIHELINSLHIDHSAIMGHSMGGKVAMLFSITYPEMVDKLIVVDISPGKYSAHHQLELQAIESIVPGKINTRAEAEKALTVFLKDDMVTVQFLLKNLTRLPSGGFEWKANMPVLIAKYNNLMEEIISPIPFDKPVLFIRGDRSDSVKDEDWPFIHSLFPQAKMVTVADAGHWVHADQPQALTQQVISFLHM